MPDEFVPPKTNTPKLITPDAAPKEPPKEVLDRTFSLDNVPKTDDSIKVTFPDKVTPDKSQSTEGNTNGQGTAAVQQPDKKDDVSTTQQAKSSNAEPTEKQTGILKPPTDKKDKKDDKKVAQTEPKLITPPDKSDKKKVTRNYEGYSNDEVAHFKQMSDPAYEYVTGLLKEKKELEKLKDATYLQHPEAYTLSPEYQQTLVQSRMASIEADAWQKALIDCEDGKKFTYPKGWDQKTGQIVMSDEVEPTAAAKVQLTQMLSNVNGVKNQLNGKLHTLPTTFKQRVDTDMQMIQQTRSKHFAWVRDPKLMDWTIDVEGTDTSLKDIKQFFVNLFPPYMRNNLATETAADLYIALKIQDIELKEARANSSVTQQKIEEVKRGEPSSETKTLADNTTPIGGVKEFSMAGFPKN